MSDFDIKTMPREELERELEARRGEYEAASKALEDAGFPEIVDGGELCVWRALSLRVRLLVEKNDSQARCLLDEMEYLAAWVHSGADVIESLGEDEEECREARLIAKRARKIIAADAFGRMVFALGAK